MGDRNQMDPQADLAILPGPLFPQKRASPFESSAHKRQKYSKSYRVRGIPLGWTEAQLLPFLYEHDGYAGSIIKSLTRETSGKSQTATVTLNAPPENRKSWSIKLPASQDGQLTFDEDFFGLTTLYTPSIDHEVDIIAISGLGGHAFGSFKEKDGEHMWLRDSLPKDLTTERDGLPMTRVHIFGYESAILDSDNVQGIDDLASIFRGVLISLVNTETAKPIILIAHSLGGLIVKQTLLAISKSQNHDDYKLSQAVYGVVFFGVPQAGMDVESLLPIAKDGPNRALIDSINHGSNLLQHQRQDFFDYLENQDLQVFCFYETRLSPTPIQNQNGKWTMDGEKKYLVTRESAIDCHRGGTASTHVCPISSTHSGMVKFSPHDHNYDAVRDRLISLTRMAAMRGSTPELLNRQHKIPSSDRARVSSTTRQQLIKLLDFDQIEARIRNVKRPCGSTCRWIRQTSEFKSWRDPTKLVEHHGFWWIRGKPGAGKSVLMKFLVNSSKNTIRGADVVSFFFNARGDVLEKTVLGLYRSLLSQIFKLAPDLQDALEALGSQSLRETEQEGWQITKLQEVFLQVVEGLTRPLVCYIDALDECPEDEVRAMVRFFEELGETALDCGTYLYICFSSRHYPYITIKRGLKMTLEHQNNHEQDIEKFINAELRIDDPVHAEEVKTDIMQKASSVFLWVVLVIPMLNREFDKGRIKALKQRLNELPPQLGDLFHDILTRDTEDKDALLRCVQWVLFARSPLDVKTLYFAMNALTDDHVFQWDQRTTTEIMRRYVVNASKGLVEETVSKTATMQFIHESVRDFLAKQGGFQKLWPEVGRHFEAKSHQLLAQCCLAHIKHEGLYTIVTDLSDNQKDDESFRLQTTSTFPFFHYAVNNILHHSNEAQLYGEPQQVFMDEFPKELWIHYHNHLEKFKTRKYENDISLLCILAELDLVQLVRASSDRLHHLDMNGGRYGKPLFAALACGSQNVARDLGLQVFMDQGVRIPNKQQYDSYFACLKPQRTYSPKSRSLGACLMDFRCFPTLNALILQRKFSQLNIDGEDLFFQALDAEIPETAEVLLNEVDVDIEARNEHNCTPLITTVAAIQRTIPKTAVTNICKKLIEKGANVEAADEDGRTPLIAAAASNSTVALDIIKQLINKGANVEAADKGGRTPLRAAAASNSTVAPDIIKQLIEKGANVEAADKGGRTPLIAAAASYNTVAPDIIKQLIDKGANVEAADKDGRTPLRAAAASNGTAAPDIIKQLIEKGANVEAADEGGRTPLIVAASSYNTVAPDIIKQLINKGANVEAADKDGHTPLRAAAVLNSTAAPDIVKQLIEKGANIEAADNAGYTPLIAAAVAAAEVVMYGTAQLDAVRYLIEKGANIKAAEKDGRTPLIAIAEETVRVLTGPWSSYTKETAVKRYADLLQLLVDKGADIETMDKNGRTMASIVAAEPPLSTVLADAFKSISDKRQNL